VAARDLQDLTHWVAELDVDSRAVEAGSREHSPCLFDGL
jgi:hypothetical protein